MTAWISKEEPLSLRLTVYLLCLLLVLLTLGQIGQLDEQPASWGHMFFVAFFLGIAYGLLRMKSWARTTSIITLWFLIVILIIGVFNPYAASDWMANDKAPPSVTILLAIITPIVVALLVALHFLGKYKARFQ